MVCSASKFVQRIELKYKKVIVILMSPFLFICNSAQAKDLKTVDLNSMTPDRTSPQSVTSEISSKIMGDNLKKTIEQEYVTNLKSSIYFYGYESNTRDLRSEHLYNIKEEEDLALRRKMAVSTRNYILTKGIPRFLASRKSTRYLGEALQKVAESTRIDIILDNANEGLIHSTPWRLSAGINPIAMNSFAQFSNGTWRFEVKDDLNRINNVSFEASRSLNGYSIGNKYNFLTKDMSPHVNYDLTSNLKTTLGSNLPFASSNVMTNTLTTMSLDYTF